MQTNKYISNTIRNTNTQWLKAASTSKLHLASTAVHSNYTAALQTSSSAAAAAGAAGAIDGCTLWRNARSISAPRSASENNMKRRVVVAYHARSVHEWNFIGFGGELADRWLADRVLLVGKTIQIQKNKYKKKYKYGSRIVGWRIVVYFWLACVSPACQRIGRRADE